MAEPVEMERRGHVAVIRLVVPDRRNALSAVVVQALNGCLDEVERQDDVRAVVLTGTDPAFCAGADRAELNTTSFPALDPSEPTLLDRLIAFPKPTVAAVNGMAVGGGASLALACDRRIASTSAWLQFNFVAVGLVPEGGSTHRLSRLVGWSAALDLLMSGRRISAQDAAALGLCDLVVDPSALSGTALDCADRYAASDPVAVRETKRLVLAGLDRSFAQHRIDERVTFIEMLQRRTQQNGAVPT